MHFRFITTMILFSAFLTSDCAVTAQGSGAAITSLTQLRDKKRVLLVFAASADDDSLRAQLDSIHQHAAEADERDLVAIAVPAQGEPATSLSLGVAAGLNVRKRFKVGAGDFVVVLVGKDGGEKLRSSKPLSFEKLQGVIDAMPMRREEMKKQSQQ